MRRSLVITLCTVLCLSTGCAKKKDDNSDTPSPSASSETRSVQVDENLLTVEITVPKEFVEEGTTQETLDASLADGIQSAVLNEDGSVTYVMTKARHREMMGEMAEEIDRQTEEMVTSGQFPQLTEIKAEDDYRKFTVKTTAKSREELDIYSNFSVISFYLFGGMYNSFNGTETDEIIVEFTDPAGNVISTGNSKDLGN